MEIKRENIKEKKAEKINLRHQRANNNVKIFYIDKQISEKYVKMYEKLEERYNELKSDYKELKNLLEKSNADYSKILKKLDINDKYDNQRASNKIELKLDIKEITLNKIKATLKKYKEDLKEEMGINDLEKEKSEMMKFSSECTGKIINLNN